ncbi:unnamed protein product [Protopolystoma xenopodis]|uniref:MPN domain-containing protein n=1 Tax=Protopolystoma xenopodis TaxID=117903 RepID=A0A3S5AQY6_9PLAT|nr:unnamed protein product [Protopolystoma xenopodis]
MRSSHPGTISFHLTLLSDRGKFISLEHVNCRVRIGCHEHPPWPDGICTKCQPSPITLDRQTYRHIDYVQFENGQLMEDFLDYWRQTGRQRVGLMLGRYAHFDYAGAPPLAIKAIVAAIYEPAQVLIRCLRPCLMLNNL